MKDKIAATLILGFPFTPYCPVSGSSPAMECEARISQLPDHNRGRILQKGRNKEGSIKRVKE